MSLHYLDPWCLSSAFCSISVLLTRLVRFMLFNFFVQLCNYIVDFDLHMLIDSMWKYSWFSVMVLCPGSYILWPCWTRSLVLGYFWVAFGMFLCVGGGGCGGGYIALDFVHRPLCHWQIRILLFLIFWCVFLLFHFVTLLHWLELSELCIISNGRSRQSCLYRLLREEYSVFYQ